MPFELILQSLLLRLVILLVTIGRLSDLGGLRDAFGDSWYYYIDCPYSGSLIILFRLCFSTACRSLDVKFTVDRGYFGGILLYSLAVFCLFCQGATACNCQHKLHYNAWLPAFYG